MKHAILIIELILLGVAATMISKDSKVTSTAVDCARVQPQVKVKATVVDAVYLIDVCAVADSAAGEDFRTVVNP